MGHAKDILSSYLETYKRALDRGTWIDGPEHRKNLLKTISELKYVLKMLRNDDTYQKY